MSAAPSSLIAGMPCAGQLSSSLADDHPLRRAACRTTRCEAGQRWDWDGVRFRSAAPDA